MKEHANSLSDFDFTCTNSKTFWKIWFLLLTNRVNFNLNMILVSTSQKTLMKATFGKKLFYASTMKGIINNKINILCKAVVFKLYYCRPELSKGKTMTSSLLKETAAFRETIRENTISQRIRGLITSRLIMITDIITCWLCQYCLSKQGNDSRLLQSKDKGSHHEPACSAKV